MDVKEGVVTREETVNTAPRRTSKLRSAILCAFVLAGCLFFASNTSQSQSKVTQYANKETCVGKGNPEDVWNTVPHIPLNETLQWVPCYTNKQCTKLMVPLDYGVPDGPKAGIAIVRVPSKLGVEDAGYRGPILFNPGGPGGSGVDFIVGLGETLQKLIGYEYDIIGFDPRGISRTTPQVVVFPDNAEGVAWRIRETSDALPNSSVDAVSKLYARAKIYGDIAHNKTLHSTPYISTALVARDMLSITKAHGFDKLQYWGFSYGTILGATYAAMFPDNVGRLILDGVVDTNDYFSGVWSNNLVDTDAGFHMIIQSCVDAGPDVCPLHEETFERVHERINSILNKLKRRPLAVRTNSSEPGDYGLVDYRIARLAMFSMLYSPYATTDRPASPHKIFRALYEAEQGNGEPLSKYDTSREQFKCECPGKPASSIVATPDASIAIACADAARLNDTVEVLEAHYDDLLRQSEFGDAWALRGKCSGWAVPPAERFAGPFIGNTSYPILFVGNTADPVTPLAHAHIVSKGFSGAVVLHQDSAGHCSLAAKSLCTAKAVREYFREGKLPEKGTKCGIEDAIFSANPKSEFYSLSDHDQDLMHSWNELSDSFEVPRFGVV